MERGFSFLLTLALVSIIFTVDARSVHQKDISLGDYIQLQSTQEFTEDGAWTIETEPVYVDLATDSYQTNSWNQIYHWFTFNYQLSSYRLYKKTLDPYNGSKGSSELRYWYTPITTNGITCTINGNHIIPDREGSVTIFGDDTVSVNSKVIAFNNYSLGKEDSYYCGDANDFVNDLYTEWYGYMQNRSSETNIIDKGYNYCNAVFAANDYVWANKQITYAMGNAYSSELYIPIRCVSFRCLSAGNAIRNSGNCIGPRISINCAHYRDLPYNSDINCNYTHRYRRPDGTLGTVHASKASYINQWATEKGIYTDNELQACLDTLVYIYDEDTQVPDDCQAALMCITTDDQAPDMDTLTNVYAVARAPGFSINQHGCVVPQYITWGGVVGIIGGYSYTTGVNYSNYRKDGTGFVIPYYHTAHVCDSGRPIFWVYQGKPILNCSHWWVGGGPSYCMAYRIFRDFCKEKGLSFNSFSPVTKTFTVVNP